MSSKNDSPEKSEAVTGNVLNTVPAALERLRADIQAQQKMEVGTVIRFTARGIYSYAAIYTANNWWITGVQNTTGGLFGTSKFTYAEFMEKVLTNSEVENIEMATDWTSVL